MKIFLLAYFILTLSGPLWILFSQQIDWNQSYLTANRESAHIAPDPQKNLEAIIQIYSARAFNWRGLFSSHTWIAIKNKNAAHYVVYQVVGWRQYRGLPPLVIAEDIPDRYWFGQKPHLILDIRGETAENLIDKIKLAASSYPYAQNYRLWPGPNSNTFPGFIGRKIPELGMVLPHDAIGKDYLSAYQFFARAPSGSGYQFSLFGMLGILVAKKEGIEINLLGLVYGVRFSPFRIELPGLGN